MKKPIKGQVDTVFRFLWIPISICRDTRWLRFSYMKVVYNGKRWVPFDFPHSDVGKARMMAKRIDRRKARWLKVQRRLERLHRRVALYTSGLRDEFIGIHQVIDRLETEHEMD